MYAKSTITARAAVAAALFLAALGSAAAADVKIAIVRGADLMRSSSLEKNANATLSGQFSKRRSDLDAQEQKFQDDVAKYQRDRDTMSVDQQTKMEKDLNNRKIDLGHDEQEFQKDVDAKRRQLAADIQQRVQNAVAQVAKERGFDLVLDNALYAAPALDITNDVVKRLNQEAGGGKAGK
jgi:outer membrane protein